MRNAIPEGSRAAIEGFRLLTSPHLQDCNSPSTRSIFPSLPRRRESRKTGFTSPIWIPARGNDGVLENLSTN